MIKKLTAITSLSFCLISPVFADSQLSKDLSIEQKQLVNLTAPQTDLQVSAWVDHENNTYQFGETITLNLKTNQDAYITLLNMGTSGKVHIIFPNQYQTNNFLKAGKILQIPSNKAPFQFKVSAPAGKEVIKVIATTQAQPLIADQYTKKAGPYKAITKSAKILSKDLAVELKQRRQQGEKWAEYTKVISIVENDKIITGTLPDNKPALLSLSGKYAAPTLPLLINSENSFALHLRSDKKHYKIGDEVKLFITAEQDCQLTVLDIGTSGKVTLLLPNRYQTDSFIRQGQTLQIPSDIAQQSYRVKAPTGIEQIVAICNNPGQNLYPTPLDFKPNAYPYWGLKKDLELRLNSNPEAINPVAYQTIKMQVLN